MTAPEPPLVAFDSDVLIYAGQPGNPLGAPVRRLLEAPALAGRRLGSSLLALEVMTRPLRRPEGDEVPRPGPGPARTRRAA